MRRIGATQPSSTKVRHWTRNASSWLAVRHLRGQTGPAKAGLGLHGILPQVHSPSTDHLEFEACALLQGFPSVVLLLVATILEVSGDAVVRTALYHHVVPARAVLFIA